MNLISRPFPLSRVTLHLMGYRRHSDSSPANQLRALSFPALPALLKIVISSLLIGLSAHVRALLIRENLPRQ